MDMPGPGPVQGGGAQGSEGSDRGASLEGGSQKWSHQSDELGAAGAAAAHSMESSASEECSCAPEPLPPHVARLTRQSVKLIEQQAERIEQHKLAPPPERKPARPLKAMAVNLWVLAIMAGIVGIIIAAKGRIHVPEPLARVHATNGVLPYVMPVESESIDYLFMNLLIGPYFPPEVTANSSGSDAGSNGASRRLAAWVGKAVSLRDAGAGDLPLGTPTLVAAEVQGELVRRVKTLLSKPKFTLARRHARGHRRLLAEPPVEEPANTADGAGSGQLPQLKVTVVQRNFTALPDLSSAAASSAEGQALLGSSNGNGSLAAPLLGALRSEATKAAAFFPASEPQFCTLKDGAAVKCSMAFRSGDLTDAYVAGKPLYLAFESTMLTQIVFQVEASDLGGLGPAKNWIALTILLLVLVAIASERIHRMWVAMIGAGCMMGLLLWMNMVPSLALVVEWLDESTLGLLFGMMIIVGRLKDTGLFELMAAWAVKGCRGRMGLLSLLLMVATAFLSAWLDNVTTMLLICPVTISIMRQMDKDPVPLMLSQALMSNIGGAATMVGDPPALIIGTALSNYLGFMDFIVNMAPGVIMACVACIPLLLWQFRRTLRGSVENYAAIVEGVKAFRITDWPLFAKCSYVTGVVLIGFLLHPVHHVDPAWFAILGAIVLCVVDKPMEVERVVHTVEWDLLLFFASMFAMIEASAEVGMIGMIAGWLEDAIRAVPEGSRTIVAIQILLWVSAFISMLLDNIPYTITLVPVIEYLASAGLGLDIKILAWSLNFGACFGGNGTLIGASANIVTATLAERAGEHISFLYWLKGGIPVTIVSVAVADLWLILRFCL